MWVYLHSVCTTVLLPVLLGLGSTNEAVRLWFVIIKPKRHIRNGQINAVRSGWGAGEMMTGRLGIDLTT